MVTDSEDQYDSDDQFDSDEEEDLEEELMVLAAAAATLGVAFLVTLVMVRNWGHVRSFSTVKGWSLDQD